MDVELYQINVLLLSCVKIKHLTCITTRGSFIKNYYTVMPCYSTVFGVHKMELLPRRLRGDMVEVYKIKHNNYDHESVPNLLRNNEMSQTKTGNGTFSKIIHTKAKLNLRKKL